MLGWGGCAMADKEHLAILNEGVAAWNAWRRRSREGGRSHAVDLVEANLSRASLAGADLQDANLDRADLSGADLRGADLIEARLIKANLGRAYLNDAKLVDANLHGADLMRADLAGADLQIADLGSSNLICVDLMGANLRGANLRGANLTRASLIGTNLILTDLSDADVTLAEFGSTGFGGTRLGTAINLESCRHSSRTFIDFHTLTNSKSLPEAFLRGCGLSDELIDYLPSLLNRAIEFYSCFISYSTKDQAFADRLYADLQSKGVRCWFAAHDMQAGRKLHEQIHEAIRVHDKLLLVLSDASMESAWVQTEIAQARKREVRENRRMLFPVRLVEFERLRDWECFDADTGKDSAREIREYYIPDFSNWKDHDSYQKEFWTLLRDLKNNSSLNYARR